MIAAIGSQEPEVASDAHAGISHTDLNVRFIHDLGSSVEGTTFGEGATNGIVGEFAGVFAKLMDEVHGGAIQVPFHEVQVSSKASLIHRFDGTSLPWTDGPDVFRPDSLLG